MRYQQYLVASIIIIICSSLLIGANARIYRNTGKKVSNGFALFSYEFEVSIKEDEILVSFSTTDGRSLVGYYFTEIFVTFNNAEYDLSVDTVNGAYTALFPKPEKSIWIEGIQLHATYYESFVFTEGPFTVYEKITIKQYPSPLVILLLIIIGASAYSLYLTYKDEKPVFKTKSVEEIVMKQVELHPEYELAYSILPESTEISYIKLIFVLINPFTIVPVVMLYFINSMRDIPIFVKVFVNLFLCIMIMFTIFMFSSGMIKKYLLVFVNKDRLCVVEQQFRTTEKIWLREEIEYLSMRPRFLRSQSRVSSLKFDVIIFKHLDFDGKRETQQLIKNIDEGRAKDMLSQLEELGIEIKDLTAHI
ncbi:MAG: hypothetical protein INQ03_00695 [Candidatus Heimdallarchaeota archaeon]|nr:hypothetical protein [Candidatus Heimdallarchaeota archaeon]